ncbi:MAG: hypothetical protein COU31_02525 [Candidatus Magasanikbacteria bacterium CG10_big_fil_rev_8_21_14_0_10_40_10]|uniref:EamA domain-containing protein n=1 Tax=Candidatus Magasanikbacteria bacterium CG10_big_fil_rev_8_21_14_0_10_40_10 TaxID=1974648 RepID=A0A2M6W404_9BACT|nr:MAG: hypothetical protein COU31_02525 [Candidatus Magasanikbacteria bacterium CG10_big_fil_rev_8_21_14_0_10_40_10]
MLWIFLSILAHFLWAWVNIGDKYIVGHRIKNPYVYLSWMTMAGIMAVVLIPFIDFYVPPFKILFGLIGAGCLYFFGGLPYIKAMQMEEPTRINVWWNLIPVFSLLIGWTFLNESFTIGQIIAFVFLLSGAIIASIHSRGKSFVFSRAIWYMAVSSLAFAAYGVLFHYLMKYISFEIAFVWVHLVMFVCAASLLLSKNFRRDFVVEFKQGNRNLAGLVIGVSLIDRLGIFFNQWALVLGSAALVYALEGFQVIFVFIIATLMSIFLPHIVKEKLDKRNMLLKLLALTIMIIGILILAWRG